MHPRPFAATEEERIAAVSQNGGAICYISSPSEAVQLAAVAQNGFAIRHISNPSEAVRLAAVRQDGNVLHHIHHPTEAVQLAAVAQVESALRQILVVVPQPSDRVFTAHLLHHPRSELTPEGVLSRAETLLEAHCPGLGDVWMMGTAMAMSEEELKAAMDAHLARAHFDTEAGLADRGGLSCEPL